MVIEDPDVLAFERQPGPCCWCGRPCPFGRDPMHILSRGAGQVDVACNVIGGCRACHSSSHGGNEPTTIDLLAVSAVRNGLMQDDIKGIVWAVRRLDKNPNAGQIRIGLKGLKPKARRIAREAIAKELKRREAADAKK